jgi:hypothetical protein
MTKQNDELSEMAAALFPCCESDTTRPWGWLPIVRRGRMWAVRGSTIVGVPLPAVAGIGLSESGVMVPEGGARPDGSHELENGVPRQKLEAAALRALKTHARQASSWTLVSGVLAGTVRIPDPESFVPKAIAHDATSTFLSVSPVLVSEVGKALERIMGAVSIQLVAGVSSGTSLPSWHIFARELLVEGVPPVFGFEFAPSPDRFRWVGVIAPTDVGGVDLSALDDLVCEKVPRRKVPKPLPPAGTPVVRGRQHIAPDEPKPVDEGSPESLLELDNPDA